MRKPLSAGLQGRLPRSLQSLSLQQDRHIQQAWDAVIQFSARHLYCPAHSPTIPTSSVHPVPTGARSYHLHRHNRSRQGSVVPSGMSIYPQVRAFHHQTGTLNKRQARFRVTPHRSTPLVMINSVRHASTAVLSIPPSFEDTPTPSSEHCHSEPSLRSSSATTSDPTPPPPTPPSESWRFPFQDNVKPSPKPASPVQSWPSTSKALSTFYGSLHLARSLPSSCRHNGSASSSSPLHLAVLNYNYLSRLQSLFDTVLVPRRDARSLFLMQGREPKTEENLEQLLRITSDLIWLDRKEKQKRRQWNKGSEDKLEEGVIEKNRGALDASWSKPTLSKIKAEYHGLRVSEYTVLMNWIGAVTPKPGSFRKSNMHQQQHKDVDKPQSKEARSPLPPALLFPVDRAWAIWQDFLRTGMKPDVVMYTALIDRLLKAKQTEQAGEIWHHMLQHQPSLSTASKHLLNSTPISNKPKDLLRHSTNVKEKVAPNLQTFSVLMQNHVANRNLEGVVQTYKGLVATTSSGSGSSSSSPPSKLSSGHHAITTTSSSSTAIHENLSPLTMANTVLLNQILAALISLGESKAAYDIFAEMQSASRSASPPFSGWTSPTTDVTGSSSTSPLHHQSFRRRFNGHKATSVRKDERSPLPTIQPDIRTYRLMLKLARRERDRELEKEILLYMTTNSK